MNEITGLRDSLPTEYLPLVYDLVRGNPIMPRKTTEAGLNVISYAANQIFPSDTSVVRTARLHAMLASPPPSAEEIETAIAALEDHHKLMASGATSTVGRLLPAGTWLVILKALLQALPLILA